MNARVRTPQAEMLNRLLRETDSMVYGKSGNGERGRFDIANGQRCEAVAHPIT